MSNYLFSGYDFTSDLNASFKLGIQNKLSSLGPIAHLHTDLSALDPKKIAKQLRSTCFFIILSLKLFSKSIHKNFF